MIEGDQMTAPTYPGMEPRGRGGKIGTRAECENADNDGVEAGEVAGESVGIELQYFRTHAV